MIDGMFQAGTDAALDDQVARPRPYQPPEVKFGVGQLLKAPFQGAASGSTKSAAFAAEMLGAFGDVAGSGGFSQGGMFSTPTPEERKQQEAARAKWIETGPQFSNPVGDELRQRAKDVMPDPTQTHAAAQIVAGVSEFATQAVTYAAAAGPLAPGLLAADVGLAESDKLKKEGVDLAARTKAGAVSGVAAGLAVALPVVGTGIKSTAALVTAGGPGTFIAQNAAERAILANAGYDKIASQYDPLDPVGLALSTLVPAAFGGVALRARAKAAPTLKEVVLGIESNGQRYGKDGKILEGPMTKVGTAKGEMQVVDSTNLDPGYGVRPAADNSPAERARVGSDYLDAMLKRYGSEDKAMAAYNAGPGALDAALAKGGDWLARMPAETQAYVKKGMAKLGEGRTAEAARATIARDPEAVAAARVRQTADTLDSYRLTPDNDLAGMTRHQDAIETAHEQLARGEPVSVSDLLLVDRAPDAVLPIEQLRAELEQLRTRAPDASPAAVDAMVAERVRSESSAPETVRAEAQAEIASRVETHDAEIQRVTALVAKQEAAFVPGAAQGSKAAVARESAAPRAVDRPAALVNALGKAFEPPAAPRGPRATPALEAPAAAAPKATGKQMLAAAGESTIKPAPKAGGEGGGAPDAAALDAQTAAVDPDLMVQLEGMDKPMKVSELLEQVKKEAADETRDASLVEVAANCFLGGA